MRCDFVRRIAFLLVTLSVAVCGILWVTTHRPPPAPQKGNGIATTGPTVERLEALEELVVQKVTVSDILTYTDGSLSASWLIRGDGLITVSLAQAQVAKRDEQTRTATVILPPPTVLTARVDHEKTVFWDAKRGIWNTVNPWGKTLDDIHGQAMKAAQRLVNQAVGSPENLEQARQRAAGLIQRIYSEFGWTVRIEWRAFPDQPPSEPERSARDVIEIPGGLPVRFWSLSEVPVPTVTATTLRVLPARSH